MATKPQELWGGIPIGPWDWKAIIMHQRQEHAAEWEVIVMSTGVWSGRAWRRLAVYAEGCERLPNQGLNYVSLMQCPYGYTTNAWCQVGPFEQTRIGFGVEVLVSIRDAKGVFRFIGPFPLRQQSHFSEEMGAKQMDRAWFTNESRWKKLGEE